MNRILSILAIAGLTAGALASCNNEPKGEKSQNGHTYINHTNKTGAKGKTGDKISMHVDVFIGDSLLNGTRRDGDGGKMLEIPVPDPAQVPAGRKLPPIFDALFLASEGDSLTFYQEIDSTMSKDVPESLKKEKFVRYEIAVYKIVSAEQMKAEKDALSGRFAAIETKMKEVAANYKGGKIANLMTLPSGLKVLVEEKGNGAPIAKGDKVDVHYYGCLTDGKMFDNSFQRGETLGFPVGMGQMIPGFDEGTQQLNHGGKGIFFLPSKLGYGAQGQGGIPANAELIFYVEVQ